MSYFTRQLKLEKSVSGSEKNRACTTKAKSQTTTPSKMRFKRVFSLNPCLPIAYIKKNDSSGLIVRLNAI
jgi:hypothetical protein